MTKVDVTSNPGVSTPVVVSLSELRVLQLTPPPVSGMLPKVEIKDSLALGFVRKVKLLRDVVTNQKSLTVVTPVSATSGIEVKRLTPEGMLVLVPNVAKEKTTGVLNEALPLFVQVVVAVKEPISPVTQLIVLVVVQMGIDFLISEILRAKPTS